MDAFRIDQASVRPAGRDLPATGSLIEALGTARFSASLYRSAREMTHAHHLTAFCFKGGERPRTLVAEDGGESISPGLAQLYADRFWSLDIANRAFAGTVENGAAIVCARTSATEIQQQDYKDRCYMSVGLSERVSLSQRALGEEIRLNFYSQSGKRFADEDLDHICSWSSILLAMVRKHDRLFAPGSVTVQKSYAERLRGLPAGLPVREIEVCDGILQGISSEGIALGLHLSVNTVRTYRKRAYARLGISSQNELMRLVHATQ